MINRILLVGWDGAEPSLVSKLLTDGRLPNLASLIQGGYYNALRSTIRPESSAAWTSLATGVNPGVHGVFGFAQLMPNSYQTELVDTSKVRVPFFWELLGSMGKRVAIMNMPMAYPPRPVNGWLVCGLMTPGVDSVFTYPSELGEQLLGKKYIIDAEAIKPDESRAQYAHRMNAQVMQRTELALITMGDMQWDFGAVIFTELDRIQHYYWADMIQEHPLRPQEPLPDTIPNHYVVLDNALGKLMKMVGPEVEIILVSDHGFCPCSRQISMNTWMGQQGWLKYASQAASISSIITDTLSRLRSNCFARHLKQNLFGNRPIIDPLRKQAFHQLIDWSGTYAWYTEVGGIRVNLQGREPCGIVSPGTQYEDLISDISRRALELCDPFTGAKVFEAVYKREELYIGEQINMAPDLVLEPYREVKNVYSNYVLSPVGVNSLNAIFSDSLPYSGTHSRYGICAANIKPPSSIVELTDVTRWILSIYGVEGISLGDSIMQSDSAYKAYNAADEHTIRERLRALGYMD
jgi:predicted AlkP superfamily phosphohydrolase/phosphomutase